MKKPNKTPPKTFLDECFVYCPETGNLIWKTRPARHFKTKGSCATFNAKFSGTVAGSPNCKTRHISINLSGRLWKAHRLIWKMHFGEPRQCLDHIDGNPQNNRLCNLRECTQAQNVLNRKKGQGCHSKYKGVTRNLRNKYKVWQAQIAFNGKCRSIGYFEDETEAAKAYDREARALHGEFARINFPD